MSNNITQQLISDLLEYDISERMITVFQKQHMNDDDLQTMDRDDVEHLFKNQYGFTFRDRKYFWNLLQKIQSTQTSHTENEQMIDSPEVLEHIYRFAEEEEEEEEEDIDNNDSKEQQSFISSLNSDRESIITNLFDSRKSNDDDDKDSDSSSYICELSLTSDYVFTYPSILPSFSANTIEALQTNTIHKQWAPFINELARWVMSIKPSLREQHEYRAIGQTLYEKYPSIGTAGPKPWSFLCRSLSQRIRTERWQRRKSLVVRKKMK